MNIITKMFSRVRPRFLEKMHSAEIIPYRDGAMRTAIPDSVLPLMFRRIVREGLLRRVFIHDTIRNTSDFIQFMKNSERESEIFLVRQAGKDVGFFWLEKYAPRSAVIHYCFYEEFSGARALEIGRQCFEAMIERRDRLGNPLLESVMIIAPSNNKFALHFLRKNGLKMVGSLPSPIVDRKENKLVDGIIFVKDNSAQRKQFNFFPRPRIDARLASCSLLQMSFW